MQISDPTPPVISGTSTPPSITINGDNPAIIQVSDRYADLGATITAPEADKNLDIKTFLNGTLVSNIVINTSQIATATIDYVTTDSTGTTATSTRTLIIEAVARTPTASSTEASSAVQ